MWTTGPTSLQYFTTDQCSIWSVIIPFAQFVVALHTGLYQCFNQQRKSGDLSSSAMAAIAECMLFLHRIGFSSLLISKCHFHILLIISKCHLYQRTMHEDWLVKKAIRSLRYLYSIYIWYLFMDPLLNWISNHTIREICRLITFRARFVYLLSKMNTDTRAQLTFHMLTLLTKYLYHHTQYSKAWDRGSSPLQVETFSVSKTLTLSHEHSFVCRKWLLLSAHS